MGLVPIFYLWRCNETCGATVREDRCSVDLNQLLETTVTGLGYELVDLELSNHGAMMRLFIDRPVTATGQLTVEDCARVSNHLTKLFLVEDVQYDRLEVSSPGLDRPVKKPADFERFSGLEAQLKTRMQVNGRKKFTGVLRGMREGRVLLEVEGETIEFEFSQIDKTRLVPVL